jgi:uncharacterized protein
MSKTNLNNVRLSTSEIEEIIKAIEAVVLEKKIALSGMSLFLFGSRCDLSKKGGDIDLLIESLSSQKNSLTDLKLTFLVKIKEAIGDQKIDVLIRSKQDPLEPFEKVALKSKKILKTWL